MFDNIWSAVSNAQESGADKVDNEIMKLAVAAYYEPKIDESVFVKIKLTQALNFPAATHNGSLMTLNSSLLIKLQQYPTTPHYPILISI